MRVILPVAYPRIYSRRDSTPGRAALMSADRPRVADVIPRMQMRGAETFAQHLEVALRHKYEMRLFTLTAPAGGGEPETAVAADPPLEVSLGVPSVRASRLRTARNLRRRAKPFGPRLVVAHGGEPLIAAVLARLHESAPIVYIRVAAPPKPARRGPKSAILRKAYSRVSAFVAVDDFLRHDLSDEFGIPAERIRVIANGRPRLDRPAPGIRADFRRQAGVPADSPMIAWVGSFVPEKDPLAAIRVASLLDSRVPGSHLVMAGDGPLMTQAVRAAEGLGCVHFLGKRPDAATVIASSDVLCSTSVTEGTPGVVVEALLAGVPVVAPDLGGIASAVPRDAGILIPRGNTEGIARAVASLLKDDERRSAVSAGARRAGDRFEIGSVARDYDALYSELLEDRADFAN